MDNSWVGEWIGGGRNEILYDELVSIDNSIPQVLAEVVGEVRRYDPALLTCWEREGIAPRLGTYLLRYVTAFYELLRLEERHVDAKLLTAELLSCCSWRAFDNCMDAHQSHKVAHVASLLGYARLIDYAYRNCSARGIHELQAHYCVMAEQALRETEEPIELNDIWKRCSVFIYPLESLAMLSESSVALFKRYINYSGLAHDMTDLISDLSSQVISLPVMWFRSANERRALSFEVVEALYSKAREEVKPIDSYFAMAGTEIRLPLIGHLLKEAAAVFEGR